MTPEHLKAQMFKGLNNTPRTDVILRVDQVITLIGLEETEKLCEFCIEITEAIKIRKKHRSAIPPDKRFRRNGYGKFNRLAVLAAIQGASNGTPQSNNGGGTDPISGGDTPSDTLRSTSPVDSSIG